MEGGRGALLIGRRGTWACVPRGNCCDIPDELNAGGRCGRKGAALTRGPGRSERGEGEGDAGCSGEAGERAAGSLGWPAG